MTTRRKLPTVVADYGHGRVETTPYPPGVIPPGVKLTPDSVDDAFFGFTIPHDPTVPRQSAWEILQESRNNPPVEETIRSGCSDGWRRRLNELLWIFNPLVIIVIILLCFELSGDNAWQKIRDTNLTTQEWRRIHAP